MKRIAILLFVLLAVPAMAAERWWESYNKGVKAVNAKQYEAAVQALEAAIAAAPAESAAARVRNNAIVYLPHYWLGVAKFNLGDVDGAVRAWRVSEDQGAIAKTEFYPKLREWVSRAQASKKRDAADAASSSKKAADSAVSSAMVAQVAALSAGADRTDTYRTAEAKLREAMTQARGAGTDVATFERAAQTAIRARELFQQAAGDAKKLKATRQQMTAKKAAPAPAARAPQVVPPPAPAAVEEPAPVPADTTPAAATETAVALSRPAPAAPTPALSAPVEVPKAALRSQLESAYRIYASGNLDASE
ncbi:MAG: hypothetical protein ACXW28_04995, partial [Thermoanaerobaculia bacterium]